MQFQRVATGVGLAATIMLAGCGGGGQQAQPPISVAVAAATRQTIGTSITLTGQITPLEQSTLSFQQSGPIIGIYVNVGDPVHAGELLAQIDPSSLRAELAQAEAAAAQASATARGSQIGLPVAVTSNTTALSTAKAAFENAQLIYQQDQELFKQGYVSRQELESARSAFVQAQSQNLAASAGLQNNAVTAQNVKASLAAAQSANAQVALLRAELAQTALHAPFEGVVTARDMDPGAAAGPSSPVLSIARIDYVWININVPDEDFVYVHPGSSVTFTTSTLPGKSFIGKVNAVNAVPTQGTLSYLARIYQPNPGAVLRGGMLVAANVQQTRHENAIVVPRTAIEQGQNGSSLFIVNGNKAEQVPVRLGVQTDVLSEVISPKITAGTQVITTHPDALQNGSIVAVNQNTAPSEGNPGK